MLSSQNSLEKEIHRISNAVLMRRHGGEVYGGDLWVTNFERQFQELDFSNAKVDFCAKMSGK